MKIVESFCRIKYKNGRLALKTTGRGGAILSCIRNAVAAVAIVPFSSTSIVAECKAEPRKTSSSVKRE